MALTRPMRNIEFAVLLTTPLIGLMVLVYKFVKTQGFGLFHLIR